LLSTTGGVDASQQQQHSAENVAESQFEQHDAGCETEQFPTAASGRNAVAKTRISAKNLFTLASFQ
jgi:hypothetical protein